MPKYDATISAALSRPRPGKSAAPETKIEPAAVGLELSEIEYKPVSWFRLNPANEVFRAVETVGLPECGLNLAHGVAYLAQCKKDRRANDAWKAAQGDVRALGNLPVPMVLRNAPTELMKELGYGKGYEKYTQEDLLPEKLKGKKYLHE